MKNTFAKIGFTMLVSAFAASFIEKYFCLGTGILLLAAGIICCAAIKKNATLKTCLFASAVGFLLIFANLSLSYYPAKALGGMKAELEGVVTEVSGGNGRVVYTVETTKIGLEGAPQKVRLKLSGFGEYDLELHDKIRCEASLFASTGSRFTELLSERSRGISVYAFVDSEPEVTGSAAGSLKFIIPTIRDEVAAKIDRLYSGGAAELMKQILIGIKSGNNPEISEAFRRAGMGHVLVISGMHLVIFTGIIEKLIGKKSNSGKKAALRTVVLVAAVIFYILVSGFGESVLRAGFTYIVGLLASLLMTRAGKFDGIGIAVAAILVLNPLSCCDIGFLLSVSASCGIIICADKIKSRALSVLKNPKNGFIRGAVDAFSVSTAAWFFVLPISVLIFDGVSLAAPFSNIFSGAFSEGMISFGLLSVLLGFVPFLASLAAFAALIGEFFEYLLFGTAKLFASFPFSYIETDFVWAEIWIIGTLALIIAPIAITKSKKYLKYAAAFSAFVLAFGIFCQTILFSGTVSTEIIPLIDGVAIRCSKSGSTVLITKGLSDNDWYRLGLSGKSADVFISLEAKTASAELSAARELEPKTAVFSKKASAERYEGGIFAESGEVTFWDGAKAQVSGDGAFGIDIGGICILYISENCDIMNIEPKLRAAKIVVADGVSVEDYSILRPEYAVLRETGIPFAAPESIVFLGEEKVFFRSRGENLKKG